MDGIRMNDVSRRISGRMFACLLLFHCAVSGFSAKSEQPFLPKKAEIPPVIDGVLDDSIWQLAPSVSGFKTWQPDFGSAMADDTVVYFAYDRNNLYLAFRCFDAEPDKIKSSVSSRDKIRSDDWVAINLDTFNDQQSMYTLYCNPLGIQMDARYEGGNEDYTIDIVWYSAGRIDDRGYTVEVKIPFKSLRFSHKEPIEMGVIFERQISRRSVLGTYPPLDPQQGSSFLTQTMTFQLSGISRSTLLEVLPGLTASHNRSLSNGRLIGKGGETELSLTAKYGITSDLVLDGTVNPDFSQVEADAGQVDFNLRYDLFFPEKRPFFLEGLEKYNFGGFHGGDPLAEIVHTRTISNPSFGIKLNGKIAKHDTIAAIYALDQPIAGQAGERSHFGIFRYKRALAKDGFLGGFFTDRERTDGFNRVYGIDGQLRINQAAVFGFHGLISNTRSDEENDGANGHALGLHYFRNTRNWILMLGLQDIDQNFRTETGYLTRNGITRFRSGAVWMFYPRSKILPRIDALVHSNQIKDKFSGLFETYNSLDFRFTLLRSTSILLGYRFSNEVFRNSRFDTGGIRFLFQSQFSKKIFFRIFYNFKSKIRYLHDPYQGSGSDATASINYQPSEKLHLDLSLVFSDFFRKRPQMKEYDYTIIRSRNVYQINRYLFLRAIVEYNSFRKQLKTDFLASFTYIPGTVIHVGYGSLYERIEWINGQYRPANQFLESRRGFFFKASYLWRL